MATVAQIREAAFVGRFDDQMSAGAASAQRALKNLGATVVETDQAVTRSTRTAESWVRSADPMTAAANRAAAAQRNLSAASKALAADMAAGGEKQAAAERALEALSEKARRAKADLEALERGNANASAAISGVGNSARLTTRELQQLSPQIADVGVTLAGGMNPLMILIQQGPQMADAVGGIGRAFTLLRAAAMTPAAAIVATGAALATVTVIAEGQARALADLSNRLRITRDDYEALAQTTENAARRAAATTSLGTADARVAGRTIASSRNFTGGEAELQNLIALSGRLATAMGTDAATAAGKLAESLDRPRQAAEALAASGLRTMDEGLVRSIRSLENQGRVAEAARLTIDAYNRAIGEVAKTPLQRATDELSNAFTRLWQQLQPVVVAIGTGLVSGIAAVVSGIASLVSGISSLAAGLRDTAVSRFLFGDVQAGPAAASASGETALQRQLRLAREANPRFLQQRDNREQAGAAAAALPGATGDDARLLRSRLQELNEAYRGMQGPVADYLRGLKDQADLSRSAEGAARELAQAEQQVREAGGGAAEAAEARRLVQERLTNDFVNFISVQNQAAIGAKAQTDAMRDGATAADNVRIEYEAQAQALRYARVGTEEYRLTSEILTGQLIQQRDAQQQLNAAKSISTQEQQLELIQRETELVGAGVVVRERELAILRERQRILNEPGADINSEQSQTRLANAGRIAEATQALQRQQSAFGELQRVGEQAFDRIGSAITTAFANGTLQTLKFGNIAKAVVSEVAQAFLRLAIINPLKNTLLGGNSPVFSLSGFGGFTGGAQAAQPGSGGGMGAADLGGFSSLRTAYNGLTSPGGLGSFFPGGPAINTGFGGLDGVLNTALYTPSTTGAVTSSGFYAGTALPGEAGAFIGGGGGASSLTLAGSLGPLAAIGGGAYGVYSGLQRGGIGGYTSAAGGAISAATGIGMLGAAAGLLPALGALGPIGLGIGAVLAIAGALMPGAKPSSMGQLARTNLNTGLETTEGLGGKRYSAANAEAAGSTVDGIVRLAREVGDKLGGARIGGDVAVGVTRGDIYLNIHGQQARAANSEQGAKDIAAAAARMILNEFNSQGTVQGEYRSILAASGDSLERLDANLNWYENVYKALTKAAEPASAFQRSIDQLTAQFEPAIEKARELGLSVDAMTAAREREIAKLTQQRDAQLRAFDRGLDERMARLAGDGLTADLIAFDQQTASQIEAAKTALKDLGLSSEDVAARIARNEDVLAKERLAIQRSYAEQSVSVQIASARTVLDYLNAQALGTTSSLSPTARLAEAERQFNAALAGGDARALTGAADALLTSSRDVLGGATAAYAERESFVRQTLLNRTAAEVWNGDTAISQLGSVFVEQLTALRAQVAELVAEQRRANAQAMVA